VPLPTAAADHQTANARALAEAGAARWLAQSEATAVRIDAEIRGLLADDQALRSLAAGAASRARTGAAIDIAARVARLIELPGSR
jgi:UDP-N-acetylglucosamine--N-acetylmuramyl-(pentapeptide) pyrophosphoryl-undecaprenol N-acetylglucosamine transferase